MIYGYISVLQGAGAFEVAARQHLINEVKKTVQGVCLWYISLFTITETTIVIHLILHKYGTACPIRC